MLGSVSRHTEASSMCILYDWPAGCGDIHITKCEQTRKPARCVYCMIGPPVVAIFMLESVNRHTEAGSMCILYDRPAGCGDIHVRKCEPTDTRKPVRWVYCMIVPPVVVIFMLESVNRHTEASAM